MKKVMFFAVSTAVFISLVLNHSAMAGVFTPSSYQVGNTLGEYLVIKESQTGEKYVAGTGADRLGRIEFSPISLSGEFEVIINADFNENWDKKILLKAGDSELDQLSVSFWNYADIDFGDNSSGNNWIVDSSINKLKLSVKGGIAQLYINDKVRGKVTLNNPNRIYTKLVINGITKDDRLFEISSLTINSLSPVVKTPDFEFDPDSTSHTGDTLGEYLIIKEDVYTQKYATGTGADRLGRIEFSPLSLSGEFEVIINADFNENWDKKILLKAGDSELDQLSVSFWNYADIDFGDNSSGNNWIVDSSINTLRLYVKEGVAKLYINDYFRGKITLNNPNIVYTKLVINGITADDRLFEVGSSGHSLPQAVPQSVFDFDVLSSYQIGSSPGENLLVKESEYGQKYTACDTPDRLGVLEHTVNLSGEFEVIINADFNENWDKKILLKAGDSELDQLSVSFWNYADIDFGDNSSGNNWIVDSSINTLRLYVKEGVAKLYINDYFRGKFPLSNPNTAYTKLVINGITTNDRLFEVKGGKISVTVKDCAGVAGGTAYIDTCGICVGGTTGKTPCATQVIWDADNDKRWSLPDIIYGLQVLTGFRK